MGAGWRRAEREVLCFRLRKHRVQQGQHGNSTVILVLEPASHSANFASLCKSPQVPTNTDKCRACAILMICTRRPRQANRNTNLKPNLFSPRYKTPNFSSLSLHHRYHWIFRKSSISFISHNLFSPHLRFCRTRLSQQSLWPLHPHTRAS